MYEIVINIVAGEEPFTGTLLQGETIISTHNFPTTGIHVIPVENPGEYQLLIVDDWGCEQLIEYIIIDATTSTSTSTTTEEVTTTSTTTIEVSTTTTSTTEDITTTTTTTTEECCFGLLYNWEITQGTGSDSISSSDDWDVPTYTDIVNLVTYLSPDAGTKMLQLNCWEEPDGVDNSSGFSAPGSGYRYNSLPPFDYFYDLLWSFNMWAKTEYDSSRGDSLVLYNDGSYYYDNGENKIHGLSIRLVNTSTLLQNGETGTYTGNDGKTYRTLCINDQEWMIDNLTETKLRGGQCIPEVTDQNDWVALTTGAMCAFDNDWSYACTEQPECTTTSTTTNNDATTTTTTTGECETGWGYTITIYYCDCNPTGGGSVGNSNQLTVGKFYYSPLHNYIISIDSFLGCGYAINSYISDEDKKDTCAEVVCPTTTTTTTTP